MNFIKSVVHFSASIVYILIIVYVAVFVPMLFGYKNLTVMDDNLTITKGSLIYYKSVSSIGELYNDDLIVFTSDGEYVIQRILNIKSGVIQTESIYNDKTETYEVKYENIKGRVASTYIPFIGYFIHFMKNNTTLSIVVSITIIVIDFILSNSISKKNKDLQ